MDTDETDLTKREEEAIARLEAGEFEIAKSMLQSLLEDDPNNIAAHFHLALLHYEKSEFDSALDHAAAVVRLNPAEPNAYLNIGCIYDKLGDLERAVVNYRKELSQNPGSWQTWSNLGRIEFEKQNYAEAARCLEKAFHGNQTNRDRDLLAESYSKSGQLEKEIQLYRSVLERDENDLWALDNLGAAYIDALQPKVALYFLQKALRLAPKDERIGRNIETATQMIKSGA